MSYYVLTQERNKIFSMHHSCVWVFTVEEMMSMENVRRKMIEENINDERIYSSAN